MVRRPLDQNLFVKFTRRSVLNEDKSWGNKYLGNDGEVVEEIVGANRPVHDNIDYIHIEIPGDRNVIVDRPVLSCDKRHLGEGAHIPVNCRARKGLDDRPMVEECDVHRFYEEYVAFKSGQEIHDEGTDLKGWPGIDPASVEELAFYKVYTVEGLAAMNDSLVGRFGGLRQRATEYLEDAKKSTAASQMRAQKEALDKALSEEREARKKLEAQVAEMLAVQASQTAAKPNRIKAP